MFERQHSVAARWQLLRAGWTKGEIDGGVRSGKLLVLHRGVYALAGVSLSPVARLVAATLARPNAVVSHESAAALWGLVPNPPAIPTLSVRRSERATAGAGVILHRPCDLPQRTLSTWQGFRCTNPLRTMVDLAAVLRPAELDGAVDRGLQLGLVSPDALAAEAARVRRQGRGGARALLLSLEQRGLVGAPKPSILESRTLRLLASGGIVPLGVEVPADDVEGHYRLDFVLPGQLVLEVDGFVYHSKPADLRHDLHRMNELQLSGRLVLRFTWFDVCHDGPRVLAKVRQALARHQAA